MIFRSHARYRCTSAKNGYVHESAISVFNLFNHYDPRDVQSIIASARFGEFFNPAWREYRGKFVLEF